MKMIDSPGNCLTGSILASILLDLGVRMAQLDWGNFSACMRKFLGAQQ